jgi:ketosteroid isomerase-like protein
MVQVSIRSASADDGKGVRDAAMQWYVALNAMLKGDPEPFAALYSHADDVTYMGAEGGMRVGWAAAYADWKEQAAKSLGGSVEPVTMHIVVGRDWALCYVNTKGTVKMQDGGTRDTSARESSVFRKENGVWKMIAHHADKLVPWAEVVGKM